MSCGSEMISDNTSSSLNIVLFSNNFSNLDENWSKEIGLIDTLHLIKCHCTSLDTHTSIYTLCWKTNESIRINTIVLHKYVIPDFHPHLGIRFFIRSTRRFSFAHPIKYLRIWTTRTRWSYCPPIILSWQVCDTIFRHSDRFPDIC